MGGWADGRGQGERQPPIRPSAQPSRETLAASRLGNRPLRPLELAARLRYQRAPGIGEDEVLEMLDRVRGLAPALEQAGPLELRGRGRGSGAAAPHDLVAQRQRGQLLLRAE